MAGQDYTGFVSPLPHPGEILREDYMAPLGLSANALAKAMGLSDRTRIERLSRGLGPCTPDTALRLARVLETTPEFWMNLQTQHELSRAAIEAREELERIQRLFRAADEPTIVKAATVKVRPMPMTAAAAKPKSGKIGRSAVSGRFVATKARRGAKARTGAPKKA